MVNYRVGDFLIQIKNASLAGRREVTVEKTNLIKGVAEVLKKEGYIDDIKEEGRFLTIHLAYKSKEPVLLNLKLVSKPGLRTYVTLDDILARTDYSTFLILSTPKGVISSRLAIKEKVGGEVIAEVR